MIEHSPDITELAKALHATQGAVDGVRKDSRNPAFKSTYASLESVVDTARPALQANSIAFTQAPGAIVEGAIEVTTMLIHVSGQWMRSTLHVPLTKKDAQGVGSAITYGCRYALMATLGLPPVDDDGEAASKPAPAAAAKPALVVNERELPQGGAADHLIELISHARNERELMAVVEATANVKLYEALPDDEGARVRIAVHDVRSSWTRRRAG